MAYRPRSSLPVEVLAWLARRLAHPTPPGPPRLGGNQPLALEVRLDAVAAVILDGLSYRRAGRTVGISKTEVGDSLDLLLPKLAALGCCQPDGTFITTLDDVRERLGEMANAGEAVCVDGLAIRVQRPSGWANQKVLYDAKRHAHTAQGVALSTIHGDLPWVDGGWPGSCHEHELLVLSGLGEVLDATDVATILDRGFRGLARVASTGTRRSGTGGPRIGSPASSGRSTACRRGSGPGGAGDRASGQRPGAAPLARAAVPGPRSLPGRWCAGMPGPLAAPHPRMTKHHGHPHSLKTAVEARACRPIIPDPVGSDPAVRCRPAPASRDPAPARLPATISDPRALRGRRHPLIAILAMAAAAVLAGARSMTAIAEWAADAPQPVRAALGARRESPGHYSLPAETTIRRTLGRLDPQALAAAIGAWLAGRDRPAQQRRRRAVAVDGKRLLAAMEHATRVELRTLKAVTVGHFGFLHAAQVHQVTRKTRELGTRRWRTVVVYAVTNLSFAQARPARLADLIRGHWAIQNGLHWVRDVTLGEDGSQLRTGTGPQVMATLRNLATGVLSHAGRSTSPPPCAATPATHTGPSPPSESSRMNRHYGSTPEPCGRPRALAGKPAAGSACLVSSVRLRA